MYKVLALGLLLTTLFTVAATAQQNVWHTVNGPDQKAMNCPVLSAGSSFCFVAMCENDQGLLGIVHEGGTPLADNGALRVTVDSRLSFIIPLFDVSAQGQARYGAPLYAGEGSRLVDALFSGSQAAISVDTQAGEIRHNITLRGSAQALRSVLRACPNRDPQFDPSDAPVTNARPSASSPNAEPANPIDTTFIRGNCVATENDIYTAIEQQYGPGNGQAMIRIWSTSPTFSDNYTVISRTPFTYRWKTGPCAPS